MKRFLKKMSYAFAVLLALWVILAQSCLTFRKADTEAKKDFQKDSIALTTVTLTNGKHHLHYAMTGSDTMPTLVFVHGTPGSWTAFEDYLKDRDLLKSFRLVAIDRPGFGYSDFGYPEHLARQSELIGPLFPAIANRKPVYLVGHSLGGPLVVKLAADYDSLIAGVAILSGSIDPAEEKPERWRPVLYKTPLTYFVPGAMRPSNEELWYLKKDLVLLQGDFRKILCPVYFVHGEADTWVPPGNVAYGQKLLVNSPHVDVTMLPGANHFIPWTRKEEIKAVLFRMGAHNPR